MVLQGMGRLRSNVAVMQFDNAIWHAYEEEGKYLPYLQDQLVSCQRCVSSMTLCAHRTIMRGATTCPKLMVVPLFRIRYGTR